ncbi:PHP domain-containing protein [Actinomadura madurae]|uniref:PHP domain-containing protein n=1 Tax=Actinomadura madurae TaxID=1993 RepID=UPI0020D25635|nr:PHP domain-containing protein [Actinomadura madurae]
MNLQPEGVVVVGSFVHLHVHTEYSMLDGAAKIGPLLDEVARQKMPAVAMSDHGNVHGAYEFFHAAANAGVKPIIGIEAYVAPGVAVPQAGGVLERGSRAAPVR